MIIVLTLAIIAVSLCVTTLVAYRKKWYSASFWGGLRVASVFALIVTVLVIPISRTEYISDIKEFQSVIDTLESARNGDIPDIELAAIQQEVIEMNKWLASAQFWAKHPLTNWFWHGDILKLEPIR